MLDQWDDVQEAIYQRIADLWIDGAESRTVVCRTNQRAAETENEWLHVSPELLRRPQESFGSEGNRRFQARGVVRLVVRVPVNTGTEVIAGHVQKLFEIFEGVNMQGVCFYEVVPTTKGLDGRWYFEVVEAMFHYVEVK